MKKLYQALTLALIFSSSIECTAQSEIWGLNANGVNGYGSIYTLPTGSTGLSAQYSFSGSVGASPQYSKLIEVPGGKLYGMTSAGGLNNAGVIYEYDTLTNNYAKKFDFSSNNGTAPNGSLVRASNGKLYGMTRLGGANNLGVIFEYDISTNVFTKKVDFTGTTGSAIGGQPYGALIESAPGSGKLYGMTKFGGAGNIGVIFEYDYVNNIYTKKVDFTGNAGSFAGSGPFGQLTKANGNLFYGMTFIGGVNGAGVIFEYDYVNDVYTKKIDLATASGSNPQGSLILVGSNLYGLTFVGGAGSPAGGVIFKYDYTFNTYTKIIDLSGTGGANPAGDLVAAANGKLYAMTRLGGANGAGVIFELDLSGPTYTKKIDLANTTLVGGQPYGSLLQVSTGKVYGVTSSGGTLGVGVIFQYNISSNTYTKKIDFNVSEGINPSGHLIQASNGKFYGMTTGGGANNLGALFEYNKTGQTYSKKVDLTSTTGNTPTGSLLEATNGKLYGVTSLGGSSSSGSLFDYDVLTNILTKRVDFSATNGAEPNGSLIQFSSNGKLYGIAKYGGANSQGAIFEFDPLTNTYTKKIDMLAASGYSAYGSLVESSGKLYGMTSAGGLNNLGVIFEYDPLLNTYTKKIDFSGTTGAAIGANPFGSLVTTATVGVLYGMTKAGGANDLGVIFEYSVLSNTYAKKYDMTGSNGSMPLGSLIRAANNKLYGVTNTGGTNSSGVLFEYDMSTTVYTKKIDFSLATGNYPAYTQLLEVCTKPLTPGAITSSTNSICFSDASAKSFSISAVANATAYAWTLPSGASITSGSTIANIVTNLSGVAVGSYTYGVSSVNECGTGTLSINTITINAIPSINVNSGPICAGSFFTIVPTGASTYSVQGNSFQVSPSSNTTYTVVGYSSLGCASSNTPAASVTVNALPIIGVNNGTVCSGTPFTITPIGVITSTISGGSFVVSPTTNTFYTITGTDGNNCVSANTATSNITVNPLPSISMSSRTMCAGGSATLSPSGASNYTIGALIGAGPFVVSPAITTSYSVVGESSFGCISSNTPIASVTVYTLPLISVNSPTMCLNKSAVIIPSGAGTSGTYTVGVLNGAGPFTVTPGSTTNYNVSGTSSLGCISSNTVVSAVTVYSLPVVAVNSGSICFGGIHTFNPSGAVSYTMTGPLIGTTFTASPPSSTSYTFSGTSSAGCVSQFPATGNVTVNALPTLSVNSGTVCAGKAYTISPSGGTNYTIQPGTVISSTGAIVSPTGNTVYSIIGQNALGCVSSSPINLSVTIIALPVVSATSGAICIGDVFTTNVSGAASYTYFSTAPSVTALGSVTLNPSSTTNYSLYGTSSVGCISTIPVIMTITVNPLPIISVGSASNGICIGESATLTAFGANTYNWGTSTNSLIVVSPVINTTYSVTGTDLNGCSNQTVYPLTVNVLPTINVISGAICPGNCFTLTPSGAFTYTYLSVGSSVICPSVTTNYSVTGTSAAGCVSALAGVATVSVVNILTVTISGNTSVCLGGTLNLTANGASNYNWSTGDATNAVTVSPTSNVTYSVLGSSGTCSNTASVLITVNPLPTVTAVASRSIVCLGENVELTASGAVSYSWNTSSTNASVIVTPIVSSSYTVTGVDANGCSETGTVNILVSECTDLNKLVTGSWQYAVYPNPNIGEFVIETSAGLTITIINALGQNVLTQQLSQGKNSINLNEQPKGIYFVQLKNGNSTKIVKVVKQ
ncbi:choice-of-anchor tandem repeat GloVer-containing protein [Aurantibacillus circumpalustris]|uniref:choice-of-anchor tandem repeat GloVer-containing protein n=1 Tax=Aurantibacillus circumpalustris TaxID=3036359 RepID=UPI00295B3B34|nr:choice-of-anchor tandem repeat GloVer-containing protein [Aurantibacillus circumpalustris]